MEIIDHVVIVKTSRAVLVYNGVPGPDTLVASNTQGGPGGVDPWGTAYASGYTISDEARLWLAYYGLKALADW